MVIETPRGCVEGWYKGQLTKPKLAKVTRVGYIFETNFNEPIIQHKLSNFGSVSYLT